MSTLQKNVSAKRLSELVSTGQLLFHADDISLLFDIQNDNTLRVTLHRLVQAKVIHRIWRGLYSILPPENIDPAVLGSACLHRFCVLTTESVLRDEGYIAQSIDAVTFVSDVSRAFFVGGRRFVSRRLHPRFLHNQEGILTDGGVSRASPERAIADLLYFDPWYHFDRPVDWQRVRSIQKIVGYPLIPHRYAAAAAA